jgi:hypothetical protein
MGDYADDLLDNELNYMLEDSPLSGYQGIYLLPGNAKAYEYFCTNCLQLRLSFIDVVHCKNCGSDRIITALPGKLDKENLVRKYRKGVTMGTVIRVDFTGIESGGGGNPHVPEGDYGLTCVSAKLKKGSDSGKNYIDFVFKANKGNKKGVGKQFHHSASLQKQSLWNLRNILESMGMTVPSKAVKIPLEKLKGKECAGTMTDDEYEGRTKSIITAFFPIDDLGKTSDSDEELDEESTEEEVVVEGDGTEEEEEPKPKKKPSKKIGKKKPPAEEEEDDEAELFS